MRSIITRCMKPLQRVYLRHTRKIHKPILRICSQRSYLVIAVVSSLDPFFTIYNHAQGFPPVTGIGTSRAIVSWAFQQVYVMLESRGLFKGDRTRVRQYGTMQIATSRAWRSIRNLEFSCQRVFMLVFYFVFFILFICLYLFLTFLLIIGYRW